MMHFVRVDLLTGWVVSAFAFDLDVGPVEFPPCPEGMEYRRVNAPFVRLPPTPHHEAIVTDGGNVAWVVVASLEDARAQAWDAVKQARDEAEAADFEFAGVMYQPDVPKITGAVLAAMLPRPEGDTFSIDWTVSDNSVVTLGADQVIALGLTLTARINAIHQRGRALRALIDNTATPAEAYGYTWDNHEE